VKARGFYVLLIKDEETTLSYSPPK